MRVWERVLAEIVGQPPRRSSSFGAGQQGDGITIQPHPRSRFFMNKLRKSIVRLRLAVVGSDWFQAFSR